MQKSVVCTALLLWNLYGLLNVTAKTFIGAFIIRMEFANNIIMDDEKVRNIPTDKTQVSAVILNENLSNW